MKITHNKVGQNLNTSDTKAADKSGAAKKSSSTSVSSDASATSESSQAAKVELSGRAQDIKKIKELANNSPDVDMNKVEKFKKLIAEGKYKVDSKAVADRMVEEHLLGAGKTSND
ncbi:MAG: FlgM, negative regulator of flagellin synthesis [Pseudobdellovibrio sp.]|jgi:negative regulator of flagellin synthesis FlgM|nr:FlgM, negative regulator of flagellin synthesis [Pseudobdellovibrio sp.]